MRLECTLLLASAILTFRSSAVASPGDPFGGDDAGCIPPTAAVGKCEDGVQKALTKYIQTVIKCHIKAADYAEKGTFFDEELCESDPSTAKGAKEKYDAAIAKLALTCGGQCAVLNAPGLRATVETLLDDGNGAIYGCPGAPFGGDDAGNVPTDPLTAKCEDGVAKASTKYIQAVTKCHIKAADAGVKGKPFDEELCESDPVGGKGAKEKYDAAIAKLALGCPACSTANASVLRAANEVDIECHNGDIYCDGTTPSACAANCPTTTTSTTSPPTSTTTTTTTVTTTTSNTTTTSTSTTTTTTTSTTTTTLVCQFLTKWGSAGSGDGQFANPWDVAVDGSGNVYVADSSNNRIQKFTDTGTFLMKWGSLGSGDGQFNGFVSVAVGSGNVYVGDTTNQRMQKFTDTGTFLTKWGSGCCGDGQFSNLWGVAVDGSGNVFVSDTDIRRIQKFTDTGTFLTKWGSAGSGDGQFGFGSPQGVAVDGSGNVYVADTNNNRIQKFTDTGAFLTKWGSAGSGDGQFNGPHDVAVGSGNVYVADTFNNRIQKFTDTGAFLGAFGSFGSGNGQFQGPPGLAVDASGNLYVADLSNSRIQKFSCP